MSSEAEPAGVVRAPRHFLPDYLPWITLNQACLFIALMVIACGLICCRPAQSADQGPAAQTLAPGTPLTFDGAVKIAITQSPAFTKSSIDINIRRMDESDSRFAMFPPLSFHTLYYVNTPPGSSKPYTLSFSTAPYNPVGAYLTLQAQKLATKAAILTHVSVISNGLLHLGNLYLQLEALHKLAGYQKDLIKEAQENLTYAENRVTIGTGTSLEVKTAQQELQLARGDQEGIALAIKRNLSSLRNFLGLPANQPINPGFRDSQRQVLGSFNPRTATLEEAKSRSYELKVLDVYKQLQDYKVSMAIAKSFPTFVFNTQTPDPLSVSRAHGLYVGLGVEVPVWDGFSRIRNISRQRAILKQVEARKGEKENSLEDKWYDALQQIQEKNESLKSAQSLEELTRLKDQQTEVRYQLGEVPLPVALEGRKQVLLAQKEIVRRRLEYNQAVLNLRKISGDLIDTYVDPRSWQK